MSFFRKIKNWLLNFKRLNNTRFIAEENTKQLQEQQKQLQEQQKQLQEQQLQFQEQQKQLEILNNKLENIYQEFHYYIKMEIKNEQKVLLEENLKKIFKDE